MIVDQPATIGALPLAAAQDMGVMVGYLPGPAMRRIADLHPGEAKTDARDAAIIAEAARTMPRTLRSIVLADEQAADLSMLCGVHDDLVTQITATSNRIRDLLTQIHPALEHVIGSRREHPAMPALLERYPGPTMIRKTGKSRVTALVRMHAPREGEDWTEAVFEALGEQTVTVAGAYDDRKIAQHEKHDHALIALAGRRCDVLFAVLRAGTFSSAPTTEFTAAA